MTLSTETLTLANGTRVAMVSTRTPQQRARYMHPCRLFGVERTDRADERTEADYEQWRWACLLRNQAADDAAFYG